MNRFYTILIASSFIFPAVSNCRATLATPTETIVAVNPAWEAETRSLTGVAAEVDSIAAKITVRIDLEGGANGSGVIIAEEDNTYYVLTAAHVVQGKKSQYEVITSDGEEHTPNYAKTTIFPGVDLAVLQFSTGKTYRVATLAAYELGLNELEWVFVSGFPGGLGESERMFTGGVLESKERGSLGLLDEGSVMDAQYGGYELAYTNISFRGMSGGPVLDSRGYVIGINAYGEEDTVIDETGQKVRVHLGKSLGVPTGTFLALAGQANIKSEWLKVETSSPPTLSRSQTAAIADGLFPQERPKSNASALDWFQYANHVWRFGGYSDAVAAFNKATERQPDKHRAYYLKGLVLKSQERYPEAVAALQQVVDIEPEFYQAWRELASIWGENLPQYSEALAASDRAMEINPDDFQLYWQKGNVLNKLQRYEEAIDAYSSALELNEHPFIYLNRGIAYAHLQQYQKALADFNSAIELNPNFAVAYNNRGDAYRNLQQYQNAIADLNVAIELLPQYAKAYYNRGTLYSDLQQYQKAIADLTVALQLNSEDALAYNNRGLAYYHLQQYNEAIADFNFALQLDPQLADAYYNWGYTYAALKDYPKRSPIITKRLKLIPNIP